MAECFQYSVTNAGTHRVNNKCLLNIRKLHSEYFRQSGVKSEFNSPRAKDR